MKAMILAAGEGTRLRPHTLLQPKPAIPFCGYPLLFYSLFQLKQLELDQIVINLFHLSDKIKLMLEDDLVKKHFSNIVFSDERAFGFLLGSGGGILNAKSLLTNSDPILICNGDEVIIPQDLNYMHLFLEKFNKIKPLSLLLTMEHPEAGKKFGAIWVDKNDKVVGFGKIPPDGYKGVRPLHFLGTQLLSNEIFSLIPTGRQASNILYDCLTEGIARNKNVYSHQIECNWYETGNLKDYLLATSEVIKLLSKQNPYLKDFFTFWGRTPEKSKKTDSSQIVEFIYEYGDFVFEKFSNLDLLRHKTSKIDRADNLKGFVVLGKNVKIDTQIKLENVVLNDNLKPLQNLSHQLILND